MNGPPKQALHTWYEKNQIHEPSHSSSSKVPSMKISMLTLIYLLSKICDLNSFHLWFSLAGLTGITWKSKIPWEKFITCKHLYILPLHLPELRKWWYKKECKYFSRKKNILNAFKMWNELTVYIEHHFWNKNYSH